MSRHFQLPGLLGEGSGWRPLAPFCMGSTCPFHGGRAGGKTYGAVQGRGVGFQLGVAGPPWAVVWEPLREQGSRGRHAVSCLGTCSDPSVTFLGPSSPLKGLLVDLVPGSHLDC